ncbi:MAG TPA: lytic transglycosylase domain-containing protein [Terriglobales bacterium]|jgi:soluble lytic murein transglycosylase-like protein|nr:lytic transglycosylase domain-containing protein [Terriglobales bacterium]
MMRNLNKLGFVLAFLVALPAFGADLAVLRNGFSIRHERRETLGPVTRLYLEADKGGYVDIATSQIDRFEHDLAPAATIAIAPPAPAKSQSLNEVINTISDRHHIDPDLINSVIHAESGFNPRAVSPKGARGLMQLMPQTASKLGVSNSFDPTANVEGGTRYLSELLQRYNFDVVKALAAYNAGPGRVEQYRGVPPYYETRVYVAKIVRDYNRKKLAQRKAAAIAAKANRTKPEAASPAMVKQASLPAIASTAVR